MVWVGWVRAVGNFGLISVVGLVGYLVGKAVKVGKRNQQLVSCRSGGSWKKKRRFRKWS